MWFVTVLPFCGCFIVVSVPFLTSMCRALLTKIVLIQKKKKNLDTFYSCILCSNWLGHGSNSTF